MDKQIFLIGFRAVGKTTIGTLLAARLGFSFLDTDQLISDNCNRTVQDIVASSGWQTFRKYEAEALQQVTEGSRRVVATGGGAVLHAAQWQAIRKRAMVIWLMADEDILVARLLAGDAHDQARPPLSKEGSVDEVREVLAERRPLYTRYAHLTVDTSGLTRTEVVSRIVELYAQHCEEIH